VRIGLILGGGGIVGMAWELGVLAGVAECSEFDPASSAVIVGTSAGSVVAAHVALGHDLDDLVERQRRPSGVAGVPSPPPPRADRQNLGSSTVPDEIMQFITSTEGTLEQRNAAVGRLAREAHIALDEPTYIAGLRSMIGTDEWPDTDLRVTSVDCQTGSTMLWTRHDGIPLDRALATSCAAPGWFPAVEYHGRWYTDAPRADFTIDLVHETGLDAIIFIGPYVAGDPGMGRIPGLVELTNHGVPVVEIRGGSSFAEVATELMDPRLSHRAVEIGLEDGLSHANQVSEALS
jgi:NTE family protein